MPYFAEVVNKDVVRVVVAPSIDWCAVNLGGSWAETRDPYADNGDVRVYCGPGYHHDPGVIEQFVSDEWTFEKGTQQQQDPEGNWYWVYNTEGMLTWYNGRAWRNLMPTGTPNVWEPGVANWREYPMGTEHPLWIQPTGAFDAYPYGFVVEHAGTAWTSLLPENVWEPGVVADAWLDLNAPEVTDWVQPTGAHDAYQTDDRVYHNGQEWVSLADGNVWEPGAAGSEALWAEVL